MLHGRVHESGLPYGPPAYRQSMARIELRRRGEGREVVRPRQEFRRLAHPVDIERRGDVRDARALKRRAPGGTLVEIALDRDAAPFAEAARALPNGAVCFVGIGLPSSAANLARLTHAPDLVLVHESGTIGAGRR